MASRERMLSMALGGRSKAKSRGIPPQPPDDSDDDDDLEYGADDDPSAAGEADEESESDDKYSERCAQDAFDAIHSGDPKAFVAAIKAIAGPKG